MGALPNHIKNEPYHGTFSVSTCITETRYFCWFVFILNFRAFKTFDMAMVLVEKMMQMLTPHLYTLSALKVKIYDTVWYS